MTDWLDGNEGSGCNGSLNFERVPNLVESAGGTSEGDWISETLGEGGLNCSRGVCFGVGWGDTSIGQPLGSILAI